MMFSLDRLIKSLGSRHNRSRPFSFSLITRELTQSVGRVTACNDTLAFHLS